MNIKSKQIEVPKTKKKIGNSYHIACLLIDLIWPYYAYSYGFAIANNVLLAILVITIVKVWSEINSQNLQNNVLSFLFFLASPLFFISFIISNIYYKQSVLKKCEE